MNEETGLRLGQPYKNDKGVMVQDLIDVGKKIEPDKEVENSKLALRKRAELVATAIFDKFPEGITDNPDDIHLYHPMKMVDIMDMLDEVIETNNELLKLVGELQTQLNNATNTN